MSVPGRQLDFERKITKFGFVRKAVFGSGSGLHQHRVARGWLRRGNSRRSAMSGQAPKPAPQLTREGAGTGRNVPLAKARGREVHASPKQLRWPHLCFKTQTTIAASTQDCRHDRIAAELGGRRLGLSPWAARRGNRRALQDKDRPDTG